MAEPEEERCSFLDHFDELVEELEELPRFRNLECESCGKPFGLSTLAIHHTCRHCGNRTKLRGFGSIGSEVEDVIDAVLKWVYKPR